MVRRYGKSRLSIADMFGIALAVIFALAFGACAAIPLIADLELKGAAINYLNRH